MTPPSERDPGNVPGRPSGGDSRAGFAYDAPAGHRRTTTGGFLLDSLRHRPVGRHLLSGLVALLFISGAGLFTYPFFTDVYTEQVVQDRLDRELDESQIQDFDAWKQSVARQEGAALTRITIPAIDVETVVVEGTSPDALRAGAGHYPDTPLPGQDGNVAIAGHRTTYGKPFNRVDELQAGDLVWLSTPVGDYRYEVVRAPPALTRGSTLEGSAAYITQPTDWQVIEPTKVASLTLTSCHPKGSAAQRIVIRAQLRESLPPGTLAARQDEAGRTAQPQALARS